MCCFCNDMKHPIRVKDVVETVKHINEEYITRCLCCYRAVEIGRIKNE